MPDITDLLAQYAQLQRAITQAEAEYQASYQEIIAPVAMELAVLAQRTDVAKQHCLDQLAALTDQIKTAALATGRSVKAHGWHAVVSQGRVSWDDAFLMGYAAAHEEILQGRRQGAPSVSLREAK